MQDYLVKSTYSTDDCIFLLKDLTDVMQEISMEEKERLIAQGVNYSEMISKESRMDDSINEIFQSLLEKKAAELAQYVGTICEELYRQKGERVILVSLARAGSPVGVLMKRYFQYRYGMNVPHYSISIIRGKGIDENALGYILKQHPDGDLAFVDGWTGKGSITHELRISIARFNEVHGTRIDDGLVVLADPAKKSMICGTKKDVCIPNACLNSTVSGLVSRTIHNQKYIGPDDFHGAKYFGDLEDQDFSNVFIEKVCQHFSITNPRCVRFTNEAYVAQVLGQLEEDFGVSDPTKIKLSIGETSRAVIRRCPKIILVKNRKLSDLKFVLHMAKEKKIEVKEYDTRDYACIAILK